MYIIIAALCLAAAVLVLILVRLRRSRPLPMDELEGHEFEYYCADLLRAHGFVDVEVTRGSGAFGTDILAEKD